MNKLTPYAHDKAGREAWRNHCGKFVRSLRLLETRDDGPSRAIMAGLRSGLRSKDGITVEMMPFVAPHLDDRDDPRTDRWFFAIAALFALHPASRQGVEGHRYSFGHAFRELGNQGPESTEKRFQLLLACNQEDVFRHLIQCVGLLRSNNIPVNWLDLLADLTTTGWDHPERLVQLKWARDFYNANYDRAAKTSPALEAE